MLLHVLALTALNLLPLADNAREPGELAVPVELVERAAMPEPAGRIAIAAPASPGAEGPPKAEPGTRKVAEKPMAPGEWRDRVIMALDRARNAAEAPPAGRGGDRIVHVRFTIDRRGRVLYVRLERGSGDPKLDATALELVRRAAPLPYPPPSVPGNPVALIVPIAFGVPGR